GIARRARRVRTGSCLGLGFGECRAHAFGELPFHLLGLGAQHRLAEAAELAGKRRVDLVAHLGGAVILGQPGQRTRGEAPDDSKRVPSILASISRGGSTRATSTMTLNLNLR